MSYSFASLLERGQMAAVEVVPFLRQLGVGAVELRDEQLDAEAEAALPAALAESEVVVATYDLICDFVTDDPAARAAEVERARVGLARAARLGAGQVLVVPGALKPGMAPSAGRALVVDGLRRCLDAADRLGVGLSVENLGYQAALCGRVGALEEIPARGRAGARADVRRRQLPVRGRGAGRGAAAARTGGRPRPPQGLARGRVGRRRPTGLGGRGARGRGRGPGGGAGRPGTAGVRGVR